MCDYFFLIHPGATPPAANSGEDCLAPSGHSPKSQHSTPPRLCCMLFCASTGGKQLHKKRAQTARATASLLTIGCSHEDRGFSEDQIWFAGWLAPSKRYCKHFSWWWGSTFFEFWHFSKLENDCSLTCRGMSFSSGLIAVACQRSEPGALFVDAVATYGSIQWKCDEVMILPFCSILNLVICACIFVTGRHGRLFVPLQAPCSLQFSSSGRRQTHTKLTHYHIQGISGITRETVTGHRMPLSLSC